MRRTLALLALLLAASCSRRERLNPLDRLNPESGGAPSGFNALADFLSVRLRWDPHTDLPIDGFELWRLAPNDSVYRPLGGPLAPSSTQFFDSSVLDGFDYRYRLYFRVRGARGLRFAEDVATPGRVRPWVVDAGGGRLFRLTPDGRDILFTKSGLGSPYSLAVTPDFGPVWVADYLSGVVSVLDPQDLVGPAILGVPQPFTIALDPLDGSGWICDLSGSVRHYTAGGLPATPGSLSLLAQPSGVATDPRSGEVWVCENAGDRVRHYARDGTPLQARALPSPSRVAVDSVTGQAWVTSLLTGWVWRLTPTAVVLDSLKLNGPIGVALDWRRRVAWVADPAANQLVSIAMDTPAVQLRVGGLGEPRDVAVDTELGEVWVVARLEGRVYRYSSTGTRLTSVGGLGDPYEVRLDRGLR